MKNFFLLLCLFCSQIVEGQHLNERYHFDYPSTIFTSLISTDSAYYVNGLVADTTYFNQSASVFAKMDFNGNPHWLRVLNSPNETYETWDGDLIDLQGEGFMINGYGFDTNMYALIIRYNTYGEFLWGKKIRNGFNEENFIRATSLIQIDSSFLLSLREVNSNGNGNNDIGFLKIDSEGETIWRKSYGSITLREYPYSSAYLHENAYLIGGYQTNNNVTNQYYLSRAIIFEVDSLGNKRWEWKSPEDELWDGANAMVPSGDGGVVVASGKGIEEYVNPAMNILLWKNMTIFKLNENHQLAWQTNFYPSNLRGFNNKLNQIIKVSDGSGYIATGQYVQVHYDVVDSIGVPAGDIYGFIAKVNAEGDSLWTRRLNYVTEIGEGRQYLYDIEETSDGGFVLCGQVLDEQLNIHYQQAWLIKVDEYGCIVPGCQIVSGLKEAEKKKVKMLLYPNPAQDNLNVFLSDQLAR